MKIIQWVKNLWAKWLAKPTAPAVSNEPLVRGAQPKRTYNKQKSKNLVELLDSLEYSFDAMKIDYDKISSSVGLSKKDADSLKKFGVSVIPSSRKLRELRNTTSININAPLPAILFMADNEGIEGDEKFMSPDFFYAFKRMKLPWYIARNKKDSILYECGFGYRDVVTSKIVWVSFFITVDKNTGEINTTHYLSFEDVKTPQGTYKRKKWVTSSWNNCLGNEIDTDVVKEVIAGHFNIWLDRLTMWSTTVSRDGHRATFFVASQDTKDYFKDRNKTVTVNGSSRKIIHLVNSHERVRNGKTYRVREHIRGERAFEWKSFDCYVTAPDYHYDKRTFFIASSEFHSEDEEMPPDYVSLGQVAERLHAIESTERKI